MSCLNIFLFKLVDSVVLKLEYLWKETSRLCKILLQKVLNFYSIDLAWFFKESSSCWVAILGKTLHYFNKGRICAFIGLSKKILFTEKKSSPWLFLYYTSFFIWWDNEEIQVNKKSFPYNWFHYHEKMIYLTERFLRGEKLLHY